MTDNYVPADRGLWADCRAQTSLETLNRCLHGPGQARAQPILQLYTQPGTNGTRPHTTITGKICPVMPMNGGNLSIKLPMTCQNFGLWCFWWKTYIGRWKHFQHNNHFPLLCFRFPTCAYGVMFTICMCMYCTGEGVYQIVSNQSHRDCTPVFTLTIICNQ